MSKTEHDAQELVDKFLVDYPTMTKREVLDRFNELKTAISTSEDYGTCLEYMQENFQSWNSKGKNIHREPFAQFIEDEIEILNYEGGYEGSGEYCEEVIEFKSKGLILKQEGAYYSYDGTHWAAQYEAVEAKEVLVFKYVPVEL